MEALGDKPCFVSLNGAIGISFNPENPFAPNLVLSGMWWHKRSSVIFEKSIELTVHCLTPLWILGGRGEAVRFGKGAGVHGNSN